MKNIKLLFLLVPLLTFAQTITLKGSLTTGNSGTDIWEYIDQNNGNVYAIVGGNGMSIVDVTDPTTPVQIAHVTSVPGFDVKVWSHYVYCSTSGGGTGMIVDVIDPNNPQIVGSFPSGHNIFIDDRGYMYNSSPGVRIYDLNPDPTSPLFLTQVGNGGHDVTVRGNLMIDCHGGSATNLYDVTDPSAPILLSSITDPTISYHHQGDISTDGNYLYINDELGNHPQADISVWDISDIANPVRVNETADPNSSPHNLYVIGNYAYSAHNSAGFRVFDITDPSNLVLIDEYDTSSTNGEGFTGAFGVYPSPVTGNIYINDKSGGGVMIFGFSELLSVEDKVNPFNFSVYPNPTSDKININATNIEINTISLFDIQGRKLEEINNLNILSNYELDLSKYNSGIYFINVNNKQTKKVILN